MKRLIFLLLFALLPCAAAAQEALYSISEVAAMTLEYYEGDDKSSCLETQNMSFIDKLEIRGEFDA